MVDWQSASDLDSIRNSCDVFITNFKKSHIGRQCNEELRPGNAITITMITSKSLTWDAKEKLGLGEAPFLLRPTPPPAAWDPFRLRRLFAGFVASEQGGICSGFETIQVMIKDIFNIKIHF